MKAYTNQVILIATFLIFSIVLTSLILSHAGLVNSASSSKVDGQNAALVTQGVGIPVRLQIPTIGVDAEIEYLGVDSKGEMETPVNSTNVGWFYPGPRPGEVGSAVIAGHLNNEDGSNAVFADLNKLKEGDQLNVIDKDGVPIRFIVQGSQEYNVGFADEVFSRNDGTYLNLVTCDGVWDGEMKSYSKRLVVFVKISN